MSVKPAIAFCAALSVSACGGSSSDGPFVAVTGPNAVPTTPGIPAFSSADDARTTALAELDRIDAGGLTAPADFQRSGSASFSGTLVLNDQSPVPTASLFGGVTMNIDFADQDNVTAQAGNFFDLANTRVTGTLTMDGAEFSEGTIGGGLVGDLTGTLQNVGPSGQDNDYDYTATLAALYYGAGVDGILVIANGTARDVEQSTDITLSGAATLERD